jgi:glycosyltransferase involved in cell wall biosynthesis
VPIAPRDGTTLGERSGARTEAVVSPAERGPVTTPTCTVAIPVFNRKDMVQRAVASALAQPVSSLDVLVVDNCSTDGTWDALQRLSDPRLRLVRNSHNVGLFGNFNRCLDLATGTYLRFLCSDDTLAAGCLQREISEMESAP